ncbi:unnamed protein product [Calicophoron daubneyi]|uniref:Clusterin-associated protein 1 n=1 Tax=Calicophoron daubneyi TaxID=300641 RepID=A0AAV2TCF2_CALDB
MSYREMRTFTEMMRSLGYPRLISMENFRKPNFVLVAEILSWLVSRYDPHADIPQCLDTEQDRAIFIKMVAHFMATRACIRLNTKKLYQANGFAVKELMKITKVLYAATCKNDGDSGAEANELSVTEIFDVTKKKQLQEGRSLSSLLASSGASLHSLLGREIDLREARDTSIRRQLDSQWVEKCVAAARDALHAQVEKTQASLVNVAADETNLDEKIEKKRNELERNRKRLSTLQSVRPAYMEEYEQLEEELGSLYSFYLTRFRNLAFLENQYEELLRACNAHSEDGEQTLRTLTEHLKQSSKSVGEDARVTADNSELKDMDLQKKDNGEGDEDEADDDDDEDDDEDDLIDAQDDDVEDDDDDDTDEDDDDDGLNDDPFGHKDNVMNGGIIGGRNQLAPGWSPSRQRIPAASYRGRQNRNFQSDLEVGDEPENTKGEQQKSKALEGDKPVKPGDLFGGEAEGLLSNDEDDDDDVTDELNEDFGLGLTHTNAINDEMGHTDALSRSNASKTNAKTTGANGTSGAEEEEDDDF